jgi:hypothetical protein
VTPSGLLDVVALQRTAGNRATGRLLQRETVADFDWPTDPKVVNSPFALDVLVRWIRRYPVSPLDPERYEIAYDRSKVEPDRHGCMWGGSPTTIDKVAATFMAQASAHSFTYRTIDVVMTMQWYLAKQKLDRNTEIPFMPRSRPQDDHGERDTTWFRWPRYSPETDQFGIGGPDPELGPAGPIVDWLDWYEFDAPWPAVADGDACLFHAQGELTGRVDGVTRLYCNDAIRAGFLGAARAKVRAFVVSDLAYRKSQKSDKDHGRLQSIDGRGLREDRPAPVNPAKQDKPDTPDPNVSVQYQFNLSKSAPTKGGAATPNPPNTQITLQDIVLRIPVKGVPNDPQFQLVLMGSATFNLPASGLPQLANSTLSNYQGALQLAYAQDLFKDVLQLQLFGQVVGGANVGPVSSSQPGQGPIPVGQAAMAQVAGGVQLAFTIPGTEKRWQIFVQAQASQTYTGSGNTNDKQVSFGIQWAPKWLNP